MSDWTPPPTTRWCIVTEAGERGAYILGEHGTHDEPECAIPEPSRADHDWLSPHGVGTTTTFGDGIAGYVWYLTMECDKNRDARMTKKQRDERAKKKPKGGSPALGQQALL